MNKNTTLKVIKSYIAVQYNISEKELDSSGIIYVNNDKTDNSIKIISWFDKLIIFVSHNLKEFIKLQLKDKNREEIFEFPYIYGQSIYFIPDFEKVEKLKEPDEFIFFLKTVLLILRKLKILKIQLHLIKMENVFLK